MSTNKKFPTRCVHEGEIKDTMYQGIVSPLFMSTTYPWFGGDAEKKPYPRYFNTPNQEFLSKKIASLENGEKALIFTSGMAAISTSIMANVRSGDHVIFQEDLYGGTRNFIKTEFDKYGIEYSSAIKKDNFYGTQFHPEKSGLTGESIIKNFLEL